jgi:GNAT superfamily N-acetyltransferase
MLRQLDLSDSAHLAAIWNAACGPEFAITPRFAAYNLRPAPGAIVDGRLAVRDGEPVGFVSASHLPSDPATMKPEIGWVDALAVLPAFQRQGLGVELLAWAEAWLAQQGCTRAILGGSLHPWTPGVPVELGRAAFFQSRGWQPRGLAWDMAHDLEDYQVSSVKYQKSNVVARPARVGDEAAILEFLRREFPGRWRYEYEEFLDAGGRMSDYVLVLTERGVDGACRVTLEDSERPIERYYLHRWPRPWGQLGSIGVSADCRGKGYGGALLDAGLRHLRDRGARGCVIDWTTLVDFYGKFGFAPYHQFAMLAKPLTKNQ